MNILIIVSDVYFRNVEITFLWIHQYKVQKRFLPFKNYLISGDTQSRKTVPLKLSLKGCPFHNTSRITLDDTRASF